MTKAGVLGLVAALALAGCFDSLVSDPCAAGYSLQGGACVAALDAGAGGGGGSDGSGGAGGSDGGPALGHPGPDGNGGNEDVCAAPDTRCGTACVDLSSDPENCGGCGHVCASGLCSAGMCVGEVAGHVVAIGHDYTSSDAAMDRVLANALVLGVAGKVHVGWWRGTASGAAANGEHAAAHVGLQVISRTWIDTALADITPASVEGLDAIVIEAQTGDGTAAEQTGTGWQTTLASFLAGGHVVVVLEGAGGVSYRLAHGAGLYDVAAPSDATGQLATIANASDAVATQVPSPYLAQPSSAAFTGAPGAVIVDPAGDAIVFHRTF